jgi:hypothetical protein
MNLSQEEAEKIQQIVESNLAVTLEPPNLDTDMIYFMPLPPVVVNKPGEEVPKLTLLSLSHALRLGLRGSADDRFFLEIGLSFLGVVACTQSPADARPRCRPQ